MVNKHVRHCVCFILALLGMTQNAAAFTDFKVQLTKADIFDTSINKFGVKVASDGTYAATAFDDAAATFTVNAVRFNDAQHGWVNCEFTIPVEGPVKIGLGNCQYGAQSGTITDAAGNVTALTVGNANCWHQDEANNISYTLYKGTSPTTLTVKYDGYCPFISVEALPKAEGTGFQVELLNSNLLTGDQINNRNLKLGLLVAADGTPSFTTDLNDANLVAVLEGGDRQDDHGWINFKATVPVKGPVRITFGTCAWGGNVTVKNADGTEVVPAFTTNTGACYHSDKAANKVSAYYKGDATTLTISGGSYVPYFAVEPVAEWEIPNDAKITFDLGGVTAEGTVPADIVAEFGSKFTIPMNRTLYVEGKTLTAWTDGQNTFAPGVEVTASENLTLTPVFTDNALGFADRTAEITAIWDFQQKNGAPVLNHQGDKGVYVTQVIVNGNTIDLKLDFDTTNGKINNGSWNDWCQLNGGTIITIPAAKGTAVSLESYNVTTTTTFAGSTDYTAEGNVVTYKYNGDAETMDIVIGNGSYFRYIQAIYPAAKAQDPNQDITGTWDFGNTDLQTTMMAFSGSNEAGEVADVENNGLKMTVEANGATFRVNGNNMQVRNGAVFKIPVKTAGDLITVKGYPGYSQYTIGASDVLTDENTYKAKISDAQAGYVAVTSKSDNNYYYSISVTQYAPKEKVTLTNEASTATFAFNEGTEGQKATFTNADYYLSSKVIVGSNWTIQDKQTYNGVEETRLTPTDQHNSNPTDVDAVSFLITPKPGFTFTPTKVSFKANRFGTDNGLIDIHWLNADGTTVELETAIQPERNNSNKNTEKAYDITSATAGEGTCGVKMYLYKLQASKQIGLADIVIEGVLNGTEKDVPVLASFKVNGNEYAVEDVFGDLYEATLKLPKAEKMVGKDNPLTDVTATSGEVGEITYAEQADACTVTIPMTAGDTKMDYVLNVIFKPDYQLEYIGVDGSVLATQAVEEDAAIGQFGFNIDDAPATKEGYKARGWFKANVLGGEKFTTADVITADTKLYAIQTEIEVPSTHKKYIFDLADKYFYAEDHEAFNPSGEGYYWHDSQHGWAFKNGNTVDLLVGPKATITVTLCQYGSGTGILVKKGDQTLATLDGIAEGDGGTAVYTYEGEAGTLTLEMQCGGEMYVHGIKIVNTAEVNFQKDGDWYFVKKGDAGSLIDVLEVVNGTNAAKDAARAYIFVPNGTYDLDATVKTTISGHNISIIGESMDGTVIVTTPDKSIEGLGKADMFQVSGTNLYLQDLTLKNALDYYAAGSAGRAAVIQDAGNRTIGKNVRMLSYQDTYYSSNSSQQAYWENCDIHGTVDFICGGGDIRFQNTTISLEPRAKDGTGSRTIVAPTTNTKFGYVFDGCTIVDLAGGKGNWNFGRTWQNEPITVYLNTTLGDNAAKTIIQSRWIEKGMNNKDPKLFGEYNTMNEAGENITPQTNTINSHGGQFETVISAEKAAEFSYAAMFSENADKTWDPAALTRQAARPSRAIFDGVTLTWEAGDATCWAVIKNDEVVKFVSEPTYTADDPTAIYGIRAANKMGGLGEPVYVTNIQMSPAHYATFYDEKHSFEIPEELKVYTVSEGTADKLTYNELHGVIPAGTAVMLEHMHKDALVLSVYLESVPAGTEYAYYIGPNLLKGSDVATMTTADEESTFYKLTYGKSNTAQADAFGWYWGAANGAAFQIEGHRAWLAIPKAGQQAPAVGYPLTDGAMTGIADVTGRTTDDSGAYYNLNGQRIAQPAKGLYIHNNKKVIIK